MSKYSIKCKVWLAYFFLNDFKLGLWLYMLHGHVLKTHIKRLYYYTHKSSKYYVEKKNSKYLCWRKTITRDDLDISCSYFGHGCWSLTCGWQNPLWYFPFCEESKKSTSWALPTLVRPLFPRDSLWCRWQEKRNLEAKKGSSVGFVPLP